MVVVVVVRLVSSWVGVLDRHRRFNTVTRHRRGAVGVRHAAVAAIALVALHSVSFVLTVAVGAKPSAAIVHVLAAPVVAAVATTATTTAGAALSMSIEFGGVEISAHTRVVAVRNAAIAIGVWVVLFVCVFAVSSVLPMVVVVVVLCETVAVAISASVVVVLHCHHEVGKIHRLHAFTTGCCL